MHQSRNGGQGRLCIGEGRVHLRRPGEVLRVSLEGLSQRPEKQGSTTDKLPVEVIIPRNLCSAGQSAGGGKAEMTDTCL